MFETIASLCTAPMKSALALIRVSGEDAINIVSSCFSKKLDDVKANTVVVGEIKDEEKVIDQVVLLIYRAPRSFTGENTVEIITHGSLIIVNEVMKLLIKKGVRQASRGEFSQRAFLNRKIDLVQAEAINDMINSTTHEGKNVALMSLNGEVSKGLEPLTRLVGDLLSLIEVNIDYPEYEDIEVANTEKVIDDINKMLPLINDLLARADKGKIIVSGISCAILGKPNVGKSSLLNALLEEEKAIVTSIPGTTRDIVEGSFSLNGIPLKLIDTAGIRESKDVVENIGIERAKRAVKEADLVIVVLDSNEITKEDEEILELTKDKKRIVVYNKSDLITKLDKDKIYVSALNKNIEPLKNKLLEVLEITESDFNTPALTSAREIGLLMNAKEFLLKAKEDAEYGLPVDLIAASLLNAFTALKKITGEEVEVDISKEIFSRFCVGK